MIDGKTCYTVDGFLKFSQYDFSEKPYRFTPTLTVDIVKEVGLGDAYRIVIHANRKMEIVHDHPRGLSYAWRTVQAYIEKHGSLPIGMIEDGPDMAIRGIIEGFYGPPWSHEDRLDMLDFLEQKRMNAYFYAPKDDIYHRQAWRTLYPENTFVKLQHLIKMSAKRQLDFYFCISPGNDFDYTSDEDFASLFAKIDQVAAEGVSHWCLLLDDIDYQLSATAQQLFQSPGLAHAAITNRLRDYLHQKYAHYTLIFCPTEYWQLNDSPYRTDLRSALAEDVAVFWTGFNTIAEYIPEHEAKAVKAIFDRPLVLWDNYPVNDVTTDMVFLGPLVNRSANLGAHHLGMTANPMVQWHLSKIALATMADYMWDCHRYDPSTAYHRAVEWLFPQRTIREAVIEIAQHFQHSLLRYDRQNPYWCALDNEDEGQLDEAFKRLETALDTLETVPDLVFVQQFKPWLDRLRFDILLYWAVRRHEDDAIQKLLKRLSTFNHVSGLNLSLRYALKKGYYDGEVEPFKRPNYREVNHA